MPYASPTMPAAAQQPEGADERSSDTETPGTQQGEARYARVVPGAPRHARVSQPQSGRGGLCCVRRPDFRRVHWCGPRQQSVRTTPPNPPHHCLFGLAREGRPGLTTTFVCDACALLPRLRAALRAQRNNNAELRGLAAPVGTRARRTRAHSAPWLWRCAGCRFRRGAAGARRFRRRVEEAAPGWARPVAGPRGDDLRRLVVHR